MAYNNLSWEDEWVNSNYTVQEMEEIEKLKAEVALLQNRVDMLAAMENQATPPSCYLCGGQHVNGECQVESPFVNYFNNQVPYEPVYNNFMGDSCYDAYNCDWQNQQGSFWEYQQGMPHNFNYQDPTLEDYSYFQDAAPHETSIETLTRLLESQQQFNQNQHPQTSTVEQNMDVMTRNMETMSKYIFQLNDNFNTMSLTLKNIETSMVQIAINTSNRNQWTSYEEEEGGSEEKDTSENFEDEEDSIIPITNEQFEDSIIEDEQSETTYLPPPPVEDVGMSTYSSKSLNMCEESHHQATEEKWISLETPGANLELEVEQLVKPSSTYREKQEVNDNVNKSYAFIDTLPPNIYEPYILQFITEETHVHEAYTTQWYEGQHTRRAHEMDLKKLFYEPP